MIKKFEGVTLEVDLARGVVYVTSQKGHTILRVDGLYRDNSLDHEADRKVIAKQRRASLTKNPDQIDVRINGCFLSSSHLLALPGKKGKR